MRKKQKRILLFSVILMAIIVVTVLSLHYIPFNKILRISGTPETAFVNRQNINTEAPHSLYFDFEVDPKSGNTSSLYKGIAHSGHYSAKTFGKNSFSVSFERKASEIGLDNLASVAMSAWVYVFPGKNEPLANFVFAASKDNINKAWKAVTVKGEVPRGKWFKISGMFDLADVAFKPDYKMVFYFWNNSSADILVDDFYIVFGGQKPRKGDSTLVDLTSGAPFISKFNFPPYPFHQFVKEETGNFNDKENNISPYDRIFSGHFISDNRGTEDLLVIDRTGKAVIFTSCKEEKTLRRVVPLFTPEVIPFLKSAEIITGSFSGGGTDQILISGSDGILAGEFEKHGNACSGKTMQVTFKVLLNTKANPFPANGHLIVADLDGNKIPEILAIAQDGSWEIYRFEKGKKELFSVLASGENDPLKQWDARQNETRVTPGHFLVKYPQDLLLTVSRQKTKHSCSWTLLRFDTYSKRFVPCYNEKQHFAGKTIGLDTLKPTDQIITGFFEPGGKLKVFRSNRDWRYDLKEIRFNDSTFQVIANMDFTGFERDFNPKYYEILRFVPAMLVNPGVTSLLAIGRNCQKRDPVTNECAAFTDIPISGMTQVFHYLNTQK